MSHRGLTHQPLTLENARKEADCALEGAKLDPYNESPWRYLIGIVNEHGELASEYEKKTAGLRTVLVDAGRDPDGCSNLTSARIDLLEHQGDKESLQLVSYYSKDRSVGTCASVLLVSHWIQHDCVGY